MNRAPYREASIFPAEMLTAAASLVAHCSAADIRVTTAESCTGGLLAALLTEIPGSSAVLDRTFVTYSNDAKIDMLGVSPDLLETHGAVSREIAEAMAIGALSHSETDVAVAITGIAGPGGATPIKPVGLVWFAVAQRGVAPVSSFEEFGDLGRSGIRMAATAKALALLSDAAGL
ncbi:MAG: CinA family protein [Hyphomicrobium sp.]|nr:CinA family protein [Hyphomicrobium sp.]